MMKRILLTLICCLLAVRAQAAYSTKAGTFTANTSTGTQSVTGLGFQPKAIIFYFNNLTADGSAVDAVSGVGMATTSFNQGVIASQSLDNQATSACDGYHSNVACIILLKTDATVAVSAKLVSMDADGFTINWTTQADGVARKISYMALGGSDLQIARVIDLVSPTSTGNTAKTGVGFTPDFIMGVTINTENIGPRTTSYGAIGFAKSATERGCVTWDDQDAGATIDANRGQLTTKFLSPNLPVSGLNEMVCDLVTMDEDGFTLNWTTVAGTGRHVFVLCLKGGNYKIGKAAQKTSTGTQAYTGVSFTPTGMMTLSTGQTSDAAAATTLALSIGAASSTSARSCIWMGSTDNVADSVCDQDLDSTKVLKYLTEGTPTTVAAADLSAFDSDGFTLNWTTADATAREFIYVCFGSTNATYGPLLAKVGQFTKQAGNGTQAITGVGFKGKVVVVWCGEQTATGFDANQITAFGAGALKSYTQMTGTGARNDNTVPAASETLRHWTNKLIVLYTPPTPTVQGKASLTSFDSDGFTITWTNNDGAATIINYMVLGGEGLTDAHIGHTNAGNSIANVSVTECGFRPDVVLFFSSSRGSFSDSVYRESMMLQLGAAMSTSSRWSASVAGVHDATSTGRAQKSDAMYISLAQDGTSIDAELEFLGMTDCGFDYAIENPGTDEDVGFIALKGGAYAMGTRNKPTGAAPATDSISTGIAPAAILFESVNNTTSGSPATNSTWSIGATDGSSQVSHWSGAVNGASPSQADSYLSSTKALVLATPGTSPATNSEASAAISGGTATLTWNPNDATAQEYNWVSFGNPATVRGTHWYYRNSALDRIVRPFAPATLSTLYQIAP